DRRDPVRAAEPGDADARPSAVAGAAVRRDPARVAWSHRLSADGAHCRQPDGSCTQRQSGMTDGVLTALEAVGLDLRGTELVVGAVCETGVGEVKNGEGVYGLRRAVVMAGAESQVMSLWKVADDATRDLMVAYYRRLTHGEGRAEALRQA